MGRRQGLTGLFAAFSLILCGRLAAKGEETVILRDGTIIAGELTRVSGDTLFFRTSFDEELPVPRALIVSIGFGAPSAAEGKASPSPSVTGETAELSVIVTGPKLTTTIRYRRGADREAAIVANRIAFRIMADEKVVYEEIDDGMDDEIRSEGWTILKNDFEFGRYEASLPAGRYRISVFAGNDMADEYRSRYSMGAVSISLAKDEVELFDGGTTTLVMKSHRPALGMGDFTLKWSD